MMGSEAKQIRILSIDGGGVKGITALCMLKEIMNSPDNTKRQKPCDLFDMICGTSTGGLIALMLGRLEYVSASSWLRSFFNSRLVD